MRVLIVSGIILLISAVWFFEQPHTLAQANIETLDANGNQAVGR